MSIPSLENPGIGLYDSLMEMGVCIDKDKKWAKIGLVWPLTCSGCFGVITGIIIMRIVFANAA